MPQDIVTGEECPVCHTMVIPWGKFDSVAFHATVTCSFGVHVFHERSADIISDGLMDGSMEGEDA